MARVDDNVARRTAAALALGLAVLAGCGGEDRPTSSDDEKVSTVYRAVEATQGGKPVGRFDGIAVRLDGAAIHLELGQGTLSFFAGCNRYDATTSTREGTMQVAEPRRTWISCPADLENVDAWLADFLAGPVTVTREPLVLTAGRRALRLVPDPDYVLPERDEVVPPVLQHGPGGPAPEPPAPEPPGGR